MIVNLDDRVDIKEARPLVRCLTEVDKAFRELDRETEGATAEFRARARANLVEEGAASRQIEAVRKMLRDAQGTIAATEERRAQLLSLHVLERVT